MPLCVRALCWSHGYRRNFKDQIDRAHIQAQGCRLARIIRCVRQSCPGRKLHVMGHSAGAAVVLAAANHLPADSIDRIVFLAPTVSSEADLRPALLCALEGIDVFCSKRDIYGRLTGLTLIGETGRLCPPVAAIQGFCRPAQLPDPLCLYTKLRHHWWQKDLSWTGYRGTHSGGYARCHLYHFMLPLLLESSPHLAPPESEDAPTLPSAEVSP
jgi:pimeloyl-ACP methyl ester carboxylesterase